MEIVESNPWLRGPTFPDGFNKVRLIKSFIRLFLSLCPSLNQPLWHPGAGQAVGPLLFVRVRFLTLVQLLVQKM